MTGVASVSGTTDRIVVSPNTGNCVVDISSNYTGQISITTVGALNSGSLTSGFTPVIETLGGTNQTSYILGDTLYASGINTLSKLPGKSTTTKQYLSQIGNGVNSGAPIWSTISNSDIPGSALTTVDDTNVTLTLGGTPSTALLQTTSITAGWTGILSSGRGGTGINNGSNTLTLGGSLETSGSFASIFTMTAPTTVTFPTSGTLATTSQIPTVIPSALTKVDDTNVTLTLGGTPSTALLQDTSITAGWNGTLGISRGGTNTGSIPTNGQLLIGNGTGYTLNTLAATDGLSITNGSGTSSIGLSASVVMPDDLTVTGDLLLTIPPTVTPSSTATYINSTGNPTLVNGTSVGFWVTFPNIVVTGLTGNVTYALNATFGDTWTFNIGGIYYISWEQRTSSGTYTNCISFVKNTNTAGFNPVPPKTDVLFSQNTAVSTTGFQFGINFIGSLVAGDVMRISMFGSSSPGAAGAMIRIIQLFKS
jgi:hypothetical protein